MLDQPLTKNNFSILCLGFGHEKFSKGSSHDGCMHRLHAPPALVMLRSMPCSQAANTGNGAPRAGSVRGTHGVDWIATWIKCGSIHLALRKLGVTKITGSAALGCHLLVRSVTTVCDVHLSFKAPSGGSIITSLSAWSPSLPASK